MINKGYNKILHDRRKELGLSIFDARKKLGISFVALWLYEEGYFIVPKKYYATFIKGYDLPDDFFTNDLLYPTPLVEQEDLTLNEKFKKFLKSIYVKIIALILLVGGIVAIPITDNIINRNQNDILNFYTNNFRNVHSYVLQNGQKGRGLIDYKYIEYKEDPLVDTCIEVYESKTLIKGTRFKSTGKKGEGEITFENYSSRAVLTYEGIQVETNLPLYNYETEKNDSIAVRFLFNNSLFTVESVTRNIIETISNQESEYYTCVSMAIEYNNLSFLAFEDMFKKTGVDYTFHEAIKDLSDGTSSYTEQFRLNAGIMVCGGVLAACAFSILVFSFATKTYQRNMNEYQLAQESQRNEASIEIDSNDSNDEDDGEINDTQTNGLQDRKTLQRESSLKPNPKIPFFMSEFFIKIGILVIMLLASLAIYEFAKYILDILSDKVTITDIGEVFKKISELNHAKDVASGLSAVALILHTFINLDKTLSTKKYMKDSLKYLFGGLIFYVFQTLLVYSTSKGLSNLSSLIDIFGAYLPGNILWSVGTYALIAMFLFSTPKYVKKNKKREKVWRLMVLLPIFYLVFATVYSANVKIGNWTTLPFYLSFIFHAKNLSTNFFVIWFCIGLYLYREHIKKKYPLDYKTYFNGNGYHLFTNILACGLIVIVGSLELICKYTSLSTNKFVNAIDLGHKPLLMMAAPILLCYVGWFGKRNKKIDTTYSVSYVICYALGFVLVGFMVLPYISYLEPLLILLLS